mmetsp:Transcript_16437/g.46787  ORF Transcript_16437/g.46787 Transcript_16437/m.46787 type:complete len:97 (-) Transcript_16437:262-552(-)
MRPLMGQVNGCLNPSSHPHRSDVDTENKTESRSTHRQAPVHMHTQKRVRHTHGQINAKVCICQLHGCIRGGRSLSVHTSTVVLLSILNQCTTHTTL